MLEAGLPSLEASGGTDSPPYATGKGFTKFDIPGEFNNVIYNPENDKYRVDWIDKPSMWLGKLVGGCSSINAALYFRTADDYVDKAAWPFPADQVSSGFDAVEAFTKVTETPSTDGEAYIQEGYVVVKEALEAIGYSAKKSLNDARNARNHSFGHPPYAIRNGLRDSPAKTCLTPLLQRSNFKLMTGAKVLYIEHRRGAATGVTFEASDKQVQSAALSSRGVVMLAAGALISHQEELTREKANMTSDAKTLWAPVKWAQRKDSIYVTVDLPDVKDEQVKLTNKSLSFRGTSNNQKYEVELVFFKEVDVEDKQSIWAKADRNLHFHIVKKDKEDEFWPRLLADKLLEKTNVHVDWSKYVDEDEEEDKGGFDLSALNGAGGFDINEMMAAQNANMMDEGSDSDDEDLPDLDPNTGNN
ncbi:hypothetical protein ATCC90586_001778 [Pythium insidiosum]|nr:hypothetical protein ATCC90586_001778 [Pythium insidiosum]